MARQQEQEIGRQEGSRWINRKPTPEEFAGWFRENVFLHEGMDHAPYLPGITLIPNKEKVKEVRLDAQGTPQIVDVEQLTYTPYPNVSTRQSYWWKWRLQHPEWQASLKPLVRAKPSDNLPEGFWQLPITDAAGKITPFIAVTYHAVMTERGRNGTVIVEGYGTKVVPLLVRRWNGTIVPDENAIAKAETGAKGRALGAADILVIPGAGIATAEDMLEFLGTAEPSPTLPPESPTLPATEPEAEDGREGTTLPELIAKLTEELRENHQQPYEEARAWAREKGYDIDNPPEQALRGLEKMLRRKLTDARATPPPA